MAENNGHLIDYKTRAEKEDRSSPFQGWANGDLRKHLSGLRNAFKKVDIHKKLPGLLPQKKADASG